MLARRGCATRICLSCRFALARPEVVVRRSPRPFPRFYLRDIEQRQFSSSGLREISRNATDAPTEGQEASSTADPFALLEAGRRHESTQGKSKPKRKAKPNAKTNADDKINATKDALVNGQEGSPSEGPKTKPKRISKSKTKAGSKAEVERPDSPPVHDPFAALEAGRRLDIPDRLVKNKSNQNDATTTAKSKGRGKAKKTKKLADVPDWLLPTESAPSVAISTAPATSQNEAVNDASQDVAENKVVEEEEKETGLETMDDEAHTEQSTVPDDGRHLDEVIGGPADETITPKKQRSSSRQELQHRDIGINALGQPGGAIVLDNPDLLSRRRSTPLDLPAEDESSFDLDLGLLKPRDDLSSGQAFSDEVMANIDELNLREVGTLGEKELIRYRDTLAGSFTTKQLETYLEAHPNNDDPSPLPEPNERKYKSIVEFTAEWTANTPRILPSMTKKQQLAYRIITRAWNVEMLGFACLGYMRLKLNSDLYTVLAQPTTGALNYAKARLDESAGETLSFDVKEHMIEICCRKESVRDILYRLETLNGAVKVVRPPRNGVAVEHMSWPGFRDEIARVTRTAIGLEDDRIVVRWMQYREPEMSDQLVSPSIPIENKGDVAMRLLRGQQHPELSGATVVQLDEMVDLAECTHVPHLVDTRSMSLSERLRPWTRWTAPNLKARLDPLPHQTPISNKVQLPAVDWQPESKSLHTRRFHASFGHILHSAPRSPALKASGVDRILAPKVPHPAAFNKMMSEDDIARSAFILLKFTPTRKKTLRAIESPVVHLKLPVNPDSDFSNFTMPEDASLYAERSGVIHDVLLPENPVDVRLNIQDKLRFAIPEQPALLKFFEASEFNLAEGRLQTPASVEFSLPPNWPKNGSKGEWRLESYDFAGLEVHQTARLEWQAHMLRYSSIEAGQQGGRRQQLTLELDFVQDQDLADQRRSFLKAVDEIAMGRAFPWTDGHKLVVEEEIPEQVSEDIGSEAVVSVEADGQALLAHREQVEEVPGQGVPQPEGLAQEDTGVAAPAFKQLGEEVASALENLQQLTSSVEDAAHSYALASLTNDPGAIPGEELWASIATEECEAAIAEADELMDTVEDALTMFVGKEPSEVVIEEAKEDVNADEDQLPHIAIEASEVPFENGHELVFSANESPAFAAEGHNSTLGDQTRDDTNHATDILHQASTNIPPPDDMNISAQPAQAENVFKPQKDEVPRQAANDTTDPVASKNPASASPVDNQAEVDESSPWGHAQSLFR